MAAFIDVGHAALYAIEEGPLPWLALIDGVALGGIYELALACSAIVATEKSTLGFPEIRLNIFPGLGGTQRMPRRSGLVNATDPMNGDAGFTAILQGKNFRGKEALAIKMVDALVPAGTDPDRFAEKYLRETVPDAPRETPPDLANAEGLKGMMLPMIQRATMGRTNPRAPYVALDVMVKGATCRCATLTSSSATPSSTWRPRAKARPGMRFFFTQQSVQKLPKGFPGKARPAEAGRGRRRRWLHGERDRLARARSRLRSRRARADRQVRAGRGGEAHGEVRPGAQEGRHEPGGPRREARARRR